MPATTRDFVGSRMRQVHDSYLAYFRPRLVATRAHAGEKELIKVRDIRIADTIWYRLKTLMAPCVAPTVDGDGD
ncbi:MAG: hypothetical protein JWM94_2509 [Sphingomonas bacterium]|nr:hypothetical protein [Sphingomonas bacterium]